MSQKFDNFNFWPQYVVPSGSAVPGTVTIAQNNIPVAGSPVTGLNLLNPATTVTITGGVASIDISGDGINQLTGDVTAGPAVGSTAATIAAGAVTLAKMANLPANTIIGNNTGSNATPTALSLLQVRTLIIPHSVLQKSAAYSITIADFENSSDIICDSTSAAFSLNLPNPTTLAGFRVTVKDKKGTFGTNAVTFVRFAAEKIDNVVANRVLTAPYGAYTLGTDGTDWYLY